MASLQQVPNATAKVVWLLAWILVPCTAKADRVHRHQFTGLDAALERAVEDNDANAVEAALRGGASVNARGTHGVTPAEYAVGTLNTLAAGALFRHGADPNVKDDQGESAVTLAVKLYDRDPAVLTLVLASGGDPNTRRADGDPVIVHLMQSHQLSGITLLHAHGADLNAISRDHKPLVVEAAYTVDWDVVWHLIQLGADIDASATRNSLVFTFKVANFPPPGSMLYDYKVKVWRLLVSRGASPVPPVGVTP